MTAENNYEAVIGLEVHAELKTKTKIFCSCKTDFGAPPNTECCPVCLGMPGTLPVLNKMAVELAIKAGLATGCNIASYSKQDRKNYFYPDLPKGYQISQFDLPLCYGGFLEAEVGNSEKKRIGITRIHIEEDAGKLIHDDKLGTLIDCNRCGIPLIEIVSEPDIRNASEATAYVKKLRSILIYADVSDCKMNEGGLRCDVNLSVRKKGETTLGVRTEMKNLNSFAFMEKAIEYEFKRQVEVILSGGEVIQETRRFDEASGKTFAMRRKENSDDYRYFPEPDLPPIIIPSDEIERLRLELPILPDARKKKYIDEYGLTAADAELLTADKFVSDFFDGVSVFCSYPKILANLIISEVMRYGGFGNGKAPLSPSAMGTVAEMVGNGRINSPTAKQVLRHTCETGEAPEEYVKREGLTQISDEKTLSAFINAAFESSPKAVSDYKAGKKLAIKSVVGAVMKLTGGRADPVALNLLVEKEAEKL